MAYEALNNLGHSGRRVVIVLNDNGRSYAPTVSQLSQSLTTLRLNPTYTAARERLRLRLRELPGFGRAGLLGRALGDQRAARDGGAAHLLRGARRPLRRPDRRARHRAHGAGLRPRRRVGRPDRRPRADPEGPRLRAGRRGRHPAPARRQGDQAHHAREHGGQLGRHGRRRARPAPTAAAWPRPARLPEADGRRVTRSAPRPTPTPSPAPCWPRPRTTRGSWR